MCPRYDHARNYEKSVQSTRRRRTGTIASLPKTRDPDKTGLDTVRCLDQHFLGARTALAPPDPEPDPACLI